MIPIDIIGMGMGPDDLSEKQMRRIHSADLLVGGRRHLGYFPDFQGETLAITGKLAPLMEALKERYINEKIVVLASGDPLFHGIGTTLLRHFPKAALTLHANITSLSAAFAAVKEPWQDACLVDLHKHRTPKQGFSGLAKETLVGFITGPETGPNYIAENLKSHHIHPSDFWTLEHLGDPHRQAIQRFQSLEEVMKSRFSHPNVVIIKQGTRTNVPHGTHLGMEEDRFSHTKGLITKPEVRAVSLAKLCLAPEVKTIWDIGAGSGSVSIEMALLCPGAAVFSLEKNKDRLVHIRENINRFGCGNICLSQGEAPGDLSALPRPDRIFIGGGGNGISQIIDHCCKALKPGGSLVINTVVLQNTEAALTQLKANNIQPEITHLQISRNAPIPGGDRMVPLNPVWIISGTTPHS